jgi:dihydrolipoamide dehydrogenase
MKRGIMFDLAIIGGGPGGYTAAIKGAQKGLKVLLIEKDTLGGTCLNRGCVPTKCFINDSRLLHSAKKSSVLTGVDKIGIDIRKMVSRKTEVIKRLTIGLKAILASHNIEIVESKGELVAPGKIKTRCDDNSPKEYDARHVILATGSKPAIPGFIEVDGHFIQTTDQALDPEEVPDKLVIIGAGVIGIEMASIFGALGSEVTVLEMLSDIIIHEDEEIRKALRLLMKQRGMKIHLNAKVKSISTGRRNAEVLYEDEAGQQLTIKSDKVLVATGRTPIFDGIDFKKLGLKKNGHFIEVNTHLETNLPGIYAIGDVIGGRMLAHKAFAEAEVVIANIIGGKQEIKYGSIPNCIWGLTEIGSVGLTEEKARAIGRPIKIGKFSYLNSASAQTMDDVNGMVKIIGDAHTGEILGVHILGAHATDLIGEPVMAMTMESAVEDLAEACKPHPTLSENIMEAALDFNQLAIHKLKR